MAGAIGVTFAPGKVDLRRGWDRDLEADLTRLRSAFGIDVIVSLMEPWEYDHLGIADLATRAGLAPIYRTVMGLGADRADGWEASKATGLR